MAIGTPILEMHDTVKAYGGVTVLDHASLVVDPGSVHALVGANGAGKSTLIKILAGVTPADGGTIKIAGEAIKVRSPEDSRRVGISFIHQELQLVPDFTVMQNLAMVQLSPHLGLRPLNRSATRRSAIAAQKLLGIDTPLDAVSKTLTLHERWMVALTQTMMNKSRLIAMDEPTASFNAEEVDALFRVIGSLKNQGIAILYITHRLEEVLRLADTVTVLRDGCVTEQIQRREITKARLTRAIVGGETAELADYRGGTPGKTIFSVQDLWDARRVRGVSLELHSGEVLGLAGLVGAGRTELARALVGAVGPVAGRILLDGRPFAPTSPREAIRRGVALVPEERRSQGLVMSESVARNIVMATPQFSRIKRTRLLSTRRIRADATAAVQRFAIKTPSIDERVSNLSGGNQQKVVIAKYTRRPMRVVIFDEPTIGVDVGARAEIYGIIREIARLGSAVLTISSDFDEFAICDRVAVMSHGRIVAIVNGATATKSQLTELCYEAEAS